MIRRLLLLAFVVSFAACSTFDDRELASFRAQRVTPPVYNKLSRGDPLEPSDVIELTRRGVADSLIIRQIEDHGVASMVTRRDVGTLRKAGVRAVVIDAMLRESDDEFAGGSYGPTYAYGGGYDPYFGYSDPWPWYGGIGIGFSTGRYYGHRHHHHRHHHGHH